MIRWSALLTMVCLVPLACSGAQTRLGDRRVFILGSEEVLASDPEVKAASSGLKTEIPVEWDTPAHLAECGPSVMDVFIEKLTQGFRTSARDSCSSSPEKALCTSDYLPAPYQRVFLRVDYLCAQSKCRLELSCTQLRENSDAGSCDLSADDRRKYMDLWSDLRARSKSCAR